MSGQPEYLLRHGRDPDEVVQVEAVDVEHPEHMKVVRDMGFAREIAGTGRYDHRSLSISAYREGGIRNARGVDSSGHVFTRTESSADGVRKVLRRLRPQEAARLDEIDDDILLAVAHLHTLRQTRKEIVDEAWKRAHVVRLNEITARITKR